MLTIRQINERLFRHSAALYTQTFILKASLGRFQSFKAAEFLLVFCRFQRLQLLPGIQSAPVGSVSAPPPCKPGAPLRVSGTAGAAEAGVVRVGAQASVHDQLAVGQLGLVEAFRRNGHAARSFSDLDFGRGADGVDARVGVTGVGAPVSRLDFIYDQAAVRRQQHVSAIRANWNSISVKRNNKHCFYAILSRLRMSMFSNLDKPKIQQM